MKRQIKATLTSYAYSQPFERLAGTNSLIIHMFPRQTLVLGKAADGRRTLTVRDDQHEYVFTEERS